MFVETGQTNDLEHEPSNGAFDFTASAISSGSGYTEATIFADANHTLVSFVTKITPSPDWFVGLDSIKVTIKRPKITFGNFIRFSFQSFAKTVLGWTTQQLNCIRWTQVQIMVLHLPLQIGQLNLQALFTVSHRDILHIKRAVSFIHN